MESRTGQTFNQDDITETVLHLSLAMVKEEEMDCVDGECSNIVKGHESGHVVLQTLNQTILQPEIIKPSYKSAKIIIHRYNHNMDFDNGVHVMLSFSDKKHFLKCMLKDGKGLLTIENCEASLQLICKSDPNMWPFVFYMSATNEGFYSFESAAYNGWFIDTKPKTVVAKKRVSSENLDLDKCYQIITLKQAPSLQ